MSDVVGEAPGNSEAATETGDAAAPELSPDEQIAFGLVEGICAASGLDWKAVVRGHNPPYLNVEIVGADSALTLGRLGAAIDALQLLVNVLASRRTRGDVRLVMDADDYRSRRAEGLKRKALELAEEVKARSEEAEFEPLPSHERRIIHTALADDPDIETWSEGDDPDRRVVIGPRRK